MKNNGSEIEDFNIRCRIKIGEAIRSYREKRGYNQVKLAEIMNISRSTISKVENGKFAMTIDHLARFSYYLRLEFFLQENNSSEIEAK